MANGDVILEEIYLAVNVTTEGVAALWADAYNPCTNWAYRVDNGSWISVAGTRSNISLSNLTGYTGIHDWEVRAYSTEKQQTIYSDVVQTVSDPSPATISLSVSVTDLGSATLSATANASCTDWAYRIDNGSWNHVSGTSTSKTFRPISGMTGTHTYQVKATKTANNITTTTDCADHLADGEYQRHNGHTVGLLKRQLQRMGLSDRRRELELHGGVRHLKDLHHPQHERDPPLPRPGDQGV